ncbi:MAG: putative methyltransferase FkbM [Sediminibacterium sp.]|nr:putative methyltransferase FkbM [Sediminibacterium sp.]
MHTELIDTFPAERAHGLPSVQDMIIKKIERIKIRSRAEKYRDKEDCGGIAYIRDTVKRGDIVFDIGAHKAGYLYFFLQQLGNSGSIFAFEPQPVLYEYLLKLQRLFSWQNVNINPFAVTNQEGKALLYIPYNKGRPSSPCATIIESRLPFKYQSTTEVDTISLDEYCKSHNVVPDFLKVDVEGNELLVFEGAKEILQTRRPPILFECEARFVGKENMFRTFQFLQELGYKGYFILGDTMRPIAEFNYLYHQDMTAHVYCNNFIFE